MNNSNELKQYHWILNGAIVVECRKKESGVERKPSK